MYKDLEDYRETKQKIKIPIEFNNMFLHDLPSRRSIVERNSGFEPGEIQYKKKDTPKKRIDVEYGMDDDSENPLF